MWRGHDESRVHLNKSMVDVKNRTLEFGLLFGSEIWEGKFVGRRMVGVAVFEEGQNGMVRWDG